MYICSSVAILAQLLPYDSDIGLQVAVTRASRNGPNQLEGSCRRVGGSAKGDDAARVVRAFTEGGTFCWTHTAVETHTAARGQGHLHGDAQTSHAAAESAAVAFVIKIPEGRR